MEWIKVEDRLPAYKKDMDGKNYKETDVLVHTAAGEVYQAIFEQGNTGEYWSGFACIDAPVLHWMPLPKPPEE